MATAQVINGDVTVNGSVTATAYAGTFSRTNLTADEAQVFPIPLTEFRVHDAFQTALGTAGSNDLGVATGTFGTNLPYLVSESTTSTNYARVLVQVPTNYVAAATAYLRFVVSVDTTTGNTSCTFDAEAYISDRIHGVSGSDLVTTSAYSISSVTPANKDFTLTTTSLTPGAWLDVRITVTKTSASAVYCRILHAELVCTTRG